MGEHVLAQETDTTKIHRRSIDSQIQLLPEKILPEIELLNDYSDDFQMDFDVNHPVDKLSFTSSELPLLNKFRFQQKKDSELYANLGGYEYFSNNIIYNLNDKITVDFGLGLLKQNTIASFYKPNIRMAFNSSVEYEITPWLSAYMYGRYIVPTIKIENKLFDPFTYMNPMFFQTETGAGLRAKYKNIKADVGMKKIYDTQFQMSNPVQSMNTKVSIGF